MRFGCQHKISNGALFCVSDCPVNVPCGVFQYQRVERPQDLPPQDRNIVDVIVLDMNHGWPNLGHDSLVHLVQDAPCDALEHLQKAGLSIRVLSFDVRRSGMVPEFTAGRFHLYLGTGGPGHIDPYRNDGISAGSQGVHENPAWQAPLFRLFDAIEKDQHSALLAACHTFGVMCQWSGIADPVLRSEAKGGKSSGILENILTPEAQQHPWFHRFSERLPDGRRLRIMDNRLFDLIPDRDLPAEFTAIGHETTGIGGSPGSALTMVEWRRDEEGVMPRVFGVNHHPEIVDPERQLMILNRKYERGEVTESWYMERVKLFNGGHPRDDSETALAITSDFTLVSPLRFFLFRQLRQRAEDLGTPIALHENELLRQ